MSVQGFFKLDWDRLLTGPGAAVFCHRLLLRRSVLYAAPRGSLRLGTGGLAMLVVCGVVALGAAGITLMLPQKSRQRCA